MLKADVYVTGLSTAESHAQAGLLGEDGADKRVVVDLTVRDWETLEELIDFLVGHLLAELSEDVAQLAGANEAVTRLVEDLEALDELVWASAGGPY